jgi:raffinose/stachyose/melibiose transport system substrate-binding protein
MKKTSSAGTTSRFGRRSRIVAIAAVAAATSLLLGACSSPGAPKQVSKPGVIAGPVSFWLGLDSTDPGSIAAWKKWNANAYEKQYPKVQFNVVPMSGVSHDPKQKTALAAGQGPDIITTNGSSDAIPFAEAGYLANLGSAAKADGWDKSILPWALSMGKINGKLVALPTSYESMVLYYNKTLFAENGWTPPTDKASLETLATEMQAKGIIPFAAGDSGDPDTEWLVSTFMNEVAGPAKLHDALSGKIKFTDPAIEASLTLMKQYFDAGYFEGGVKQYFTATDDKKLAQFASGKAGMYISGSWDLETWPTLFGVKGNKDDWGWAPLPPLAPGVPSDVYPLSVGGTISVNAHSSNISGSTSYLKWLYSDTKNMWDSALETGTEPLPITYTDADVPKGMDPRYVSQYDAINTASKKGLVGYVTWTSFGGKADEYIIENSDKVLNGNLTVDAFCQGIQRAFDADKAAGLIPALFPTKG